ncbi:MAG TPA: sulfite exporter TauE/SafE family protein [Pyrinomonadaceae bacterium]|nr:sulfite exporter TauE/SafE family protein [Pyrinomonadaceae bacterium]
MTPLALAALALLIFAAAMLYSSVGHAGASGYLAAMALLGVAPAVMKPTALTLNILVATIATVKFYRAGCFSWRLLLPFAAASIPFAFTGGYVSLPGHWYKTLVGVILLFAAYRLFRIAHKAAEQTEVKRIPLWAALLSGAAIGLLSGLTGTGGGIFLSPLLLFMGWAEIRQAAGVSAAFILVNSIAGLLGNVSSVGALPASSIFVFAPAAVIGGFIGAGYGSRRIAGANLRRLLAVVLIIAGLKLIFT